MGVLYEHWRPDTNECFYVGVSWADEDNRPYEMKDRHSNHHKVQQELSEKGLVPEVRIQAKADWLTKEILCQIEPLQISYWKELIGDRLVNIAKGGEGIHIYWNNNLREKLSKSLKLFYSTEEGKNLHLELTNRQKENSENHFMKLLENREWKKQEWEEKFGGSPALVPEIAAKISATTLAKGANHQCKRPEVRAKISASVSGKNHPNWGKTTSFNQKLSASFSNLVRGMRYWGA